MNAGPDSAGDQGPDKSTVVHNSGGSKESPWWKVVAITFSCAGLGVAIWTAVDTSGDTEKSYKLARSNEDRLNRQDVQRYSDKVFLAQAPSAAYPAAVGECDTDWFANPKNSALWAVWNTSEGPIFDAWAETESGRRVFLATIAPHSLGVMKPPGIVGKAVHFRDSNGQNWTRGTTSEPVSGSNDIPVASNGVTINARNDDGESIHIPISTELATKCPPA